MRICAHAKGNEDAAQRTQLCGIGPQTASALVATVSNPQDFRNGRQLAAWAGLVPRQYSTGGKTVLGPITKRGDSLPSGPAHPGCTLGSAVGLEAQARETITPGAMDRRPARQGRLSQDLVAIANKHLRMIWAILARARTLTQRPGCATPNRHELKLKKLSLHQDANRQIDNEVGPSTVKTWLTMWQRTTRGRTIICCVPLSNNE